MGLSIYKSGQGYYTRVLTAVGVATLVIAGVAWLANEMEGITAIPTIYAQAIMAVVVITFFALLTFYLLNKPNIADFMIATESEMKKVNWPTFREVVGSTVVVISGTLMIALLLFVVDIIFGFFFSQIGIIRADL